MSDGIPRMPRQLTARERFGDTLFLYMQFTSFLILIAGGPLGYWWYKGWGVLTGLFAGFFIGVWMRRSMGLRGEPNKGWFIRKREIANGSRRGLLEWIIEKVRGNEVTREKCIKITQAYDNAMRELRSISDPSERKKVLDELDRRIKEISYD